MRDRLRMHSEIRNWLTELRVSFAAAAVLVLAAFGVLVAVRALHWGRVLDVRSLG